jgi:hypothetical protein
LIGWLAYGAMRSDGIDGWIVSALCIGAVLYILGYRWFKNQSNIEADPTADLASYQAELLARIDIQLALMRKARYWYLVPLWILFVAVLGNTLRVMLSRSSTWIDYAGWGFQLLVALGTSFALVWSAEVKATNALRSERSRVEEAIRQCREEA